MVNSYDDLSKYGDTKWGICLIILAIGIFNIAHRFIRQYCVPLQIKLKGKEEVSKWCNLLLSWVHALVLGIWDLLCFYYYPELLDDLVEFRNLFIYYAIVVTTGYFIHDFGDMVVHDKIFKQWELTLHHIAVLMLFLYNMLGLTCIGYTAVALLCEVNSFFLHSRKLLLLLNGPERHPRFYRAMAVANIASFVFFRGYSILRIDYGMIYDRHRVSGTYYTVLCVSMFVMNLLNPALLWTLLRNDFFRHRFFRKKSCVGNSACSNSSVSTVKTSCNGLQLDPSAAHMHRLENHHNDHLVSSAPIY